MDDRRWQFLDLAEWRYGVVLMSQIANMTYLNSNNGVEHIVRGTFTLQAGISPSSATLVTMPQASLLPSVGVLTISYTQVGGGVTAEDQTITFPECAVNQATLQKEGPYLWNIQILDRRWKWRFGDISGEYNKKNKDGSIIASTEKTPRELAALLSTAMGETVAVDATLLPNDTRPHVKWDVANPARELDKICIDLGCIIHLQLDNTAKIFQLETGTALPTIDVTEQALAMLYKLTPDSVKLVGDPTEFQSRLVLEAVGLDTDDTVKLLADLSYNVIDNDNDLITFADVGNNFTEDARKLAVRSCYKWYRIKEQVGGGLELPGGIETLNKVEQIHLLSGMSQENTIFTTLKERKKPLVYGTFYSHDPRHIAAGKQDVSRQYEGSFSIDTKRGLVQFSNQVFRADGDFHRPADLVLECAYTATGNDGALIRYNKTRTIPNITHTTEPKILKNKNVKQTIRVTYDNSIPGVETGEIDNVTSQDDEANFYLDADQALYVITDADSAQYFGIKAINLDGLVKTVSWVVGGGAVARTAASTDSRANPFVPNYDEKRIRERQRAANDRLLELVGEVELEGQALSSDVGSPIIP